MCELIKVRFYNNNFNSKKILFTRTTTNIPRVEEIVVTKINEQFYRWK